MLTGKSSLETAVAALRHGAFDYLTKPCRLVDLQTVLQRVAEKRELTNKYRALKERLERIEGTSDLIGDSAPMQAVRTLIAKVAPTDSTVMIFGETGTGKELVARAVHDQSLRAEMPLVPINCGALPENLIESELFGHRKGSFTGADEHRVGLLQVASGGTLFLDEIGELPKAMQAKLLRFLESGEIRRVGENDAVSCDVRGRLRHAPQAGRDGRRRRVPRGPLVPDQHVRDLSAAAARAGRRHSGAGPAPGAAVSPVDPLGRRGLQPRGDVALDGTLLAGQRSRAGQRDRARDDPLRAAADLDRAPAAAVRHAAIPHRRARRVDKTDAPRSGDAGDLRRAWTARAATRPRPPRR